MKRDKSLLQRLLHFVLLLIPQQTFDCAGNFLSLTPLLATILGRSLAMGKCRIGRTLAPLIPLDLLRQDLDTFLFLLEDLLLFALYHLSFVSLLELG